MTFLKFLIAYLISINIITFIVCWYDKRNSIKHKWRISEKTLLLLSLIGGSLGMILGMNLFHHKTKKLKFKLVYIFIIIHLYILLKIFEII